jgi:abhydrolase domain-containing protein 17
MGNMFNSGSGIDSISSVDNFVTDILYHPPDTTTRGDILRLDSNSTSVFMLNDICVLEVYPDEISHKRYPTKIMILSHGNASDVFTMYSFLKLMANTYKMVCICYDYPGYGISNGRPSEKTCCNALTQVVNYYLTMSSTKYCINKKKLYCKNKNDKLITQYDILLIGQSLGTGVVVDFLSKQNWLSTSVLISPYKSIPRVFSDTSIGSVIRNNAYNSINKIKRTVGPILMIHGLNDTLIPYRHTSELHQNIPNKLHSPIYLKNIGHNDILQSIIEKNLLINAIYNN